MNTLHANNKGLTLLELLIALSISSVILMAVASLCQTTQRMMKGMEGDTLSSYIAVEELSRAVSRSRDIIVPSASEFKARLDYENSTGIWRPRYTPSDASDDTWISVKWFGSPTNKVYYFYSTGASEPRAADVTDQLLTSKDITDCSFSIIDQKLLHWNMTVGSNSARNWYRRDVLASEMI